MDGKQPRTIERKALRRRLVCAAVGLAASGAILLVPASAGADGVAARSADSFVESIGVNIHTSYTDTPYSQQFETIKQRLAELGVHHVRDGLMPNRPDQYENLNALAAGGVKSTLILGDPSIGTAGLDELISTLKTSVLGSVDAVEGPNEYDTRGGSGWAAALTTYQQQLYSAVKSDPALAGLPVIGPSIVQKRNQEALGDISGSLDYGNIHPYPLGAAPEGNVTSYLSRAADNSGSKPVMATETGYHNAMSWTGEQSPVSEQAAAVYMPRLFLEYFNRGIARTFAYELVDEWPDKTARESNWGLLRNDLSEKPAFVALKNLIAILQDPGPSFSPESVDYSVGGDETNLRQVLIEKRDGSFYLALWRADSVWDSTTNAPISVPSTPVRLEFARPVKEVQLFEPNVSPAPTSSIAARGNRLNLNVGAQVTLLRLDLGSVPSGRISLWVSRRSVPAGGHIAVRGRLPGQPAGHSLPISFQRWQVDLSKWQTIGHDRSSASGKFRKTILIPGQQGSISRLRVVGRAARPSKPVRLHVRGSHLAPVAAISTARRAAAHSG